MQSSLMRSAAALRPLGLRSRPTFYRTLRTRPAPRGGPSNSSSQSQPQPQQENPSTPDGNANPAPNASVSAMLANTRPEENPLLSPVYVPEDPNAILKSTHPATNLLSQSGLIVQRDIEMMNILLGFEQANRYVIMDPQGNHVGYMAEHDGGLGKAMTRQWLRTHRAFTTHIFDRQQNEVLRFHRPFSLINTRIRVYDPLEPATNYAISNSRDVATVPELNPEAARQISQVPLEAMRIVGEAHSEWAPMRRKYNLFLAHDPSSIAGTPDTISTERAKDLSETQREQVSRQAGRNPEPVFSQFAYIDERFLSWDFSLLGADGRLLGSVNRNFRGFAREIFTDTGMYVLRMDSAGLEEEAQKTHVVSNTAGGERAYAEAVGGSNDRLGMTLDQRAVMLATAVTVDYDYFSRHSNAGGMGMMPFYMGGGGEAAGGVAAGGVAAEAGAVEAGGAVVGGAGRAVGGAAAAAGEGAIAGAGTLAGYEAMQRGLGRGEEQPSSPEPQQGAPPSSQQDPGQGYGGAPPGEASQAQNEDVWGGGDQDPWSEGSQATNGGEGGEGGGMGSTLWGAFFGDD